MKPYSHRRLSAILLLASLALPAVAARAIEQGAILTAEGTTTLELSGGPVAASMQGEHAVLNGSAFSPDEVVSLWMTFADGSVFGFGIDHLNAGGDGAFEIEIGLPATLPIGLHQITARGQSSGRGAVVPFYLLPGQGPQATQGTGLVVTPEAPRQLETVELAGSGFESGETVALWLTLPDGVVVALGQQSADATGSFLTSLTVPSFLPIGHYSATARGDRSGNTAIALFMVQYGNGLDVPGAALAVNIGRATQGTLLEVVASGFTRGESVSFWLTRPDGAVLDLGASRADDAGDLSASFYLSETLPVGRYYLSLHSNESKQGSFASLELEPGP